LIISLLLVLIQGFNRDDFTQESYHIENPNEVRDSIDDVREKTDVGKVAVKNDQMRLQDFLEEEKKEWKLMSTKEEWL
jgi:hypothetical protein